MSLAKIRRTKEGVPFREMVERTMLAYSTPMAHETTGTRTASIGAGLENLIAVSNKRYEQLDLGCVIKNELRRSVINGRLIFKQKQTVDFSGYLVGVGHVSFDAKSTREPVWRPINEALHQLCYLLRGQRQIRTQAWVHEKDRDCRQCENARFFYLIEHRQLDTSRGALAERSTVYLLEDLEALLDRGVYEYRDQDRVECGERGVLLDYRSKLLSGSVDVIDQRTAATAQAPAQ